MHWVVRIFFVLCLITFSAREQLGSTGSLAENRSKFFSNAFHSMRHGAGRGKPEGRKRLPISLGFKCAQCKSEFESLHSMDIHRRHSSLVGTPCADPSNSKSISFTERGDQFAGSLRQHDTLGVLPMPAFCCFENAHFTYREKCNNCNNCNKIHNRVIIAYNSK